ncbi:MAG: DUF4301 family protein [Cytophagales bacterium]|nr:DUF4301 family protein [Cytophagales bacterium]
MFSASDKQQINDHGLDLETVERQIAYFKKGFPPSKLKAPAIDGSGIMILDDAAIANAISGYDELSADKTIVKFVPASGAASRMFKKLFAFLESYQGTEADYQELIADQKGGSVFEFLKKLEDFAFYDELTDQFGADKSLQQAHVKREYGAIIGALLNKDGMNYGSLPKGLLKFHRENGVVRTPVEEHVVEGCQYAKGADGSVALHFTVSPEHQSAFEAHVESLRTSYESKFDCKLQVSYSIQQPGTDTIAVDLENEPFRNEDGSLLFRPAGHGALLANLNEIDADVVFLKNIDNVVPDRLKEETIKFKKVIGGLLLKLQSQVFAHVDALKSGKGDLKAIQQFIEEKLGYRSDSDLSGEALLKILDRPMRVCGMVKSDGDPGGGPFWVDNGDGTSSLQVVETAQIDLSGEGQKEVFNAATHFNPVDVVCGLRNAQGEKYDLMQFRDPETGFATEKSKDGKSLKAQELPGLWNGSMAFWNTVFVEVPLITFNPVKAVNDLLKPEHQG